VCLPRAIGVYLSNDETLTLLLELIAVYPDDLTEDLKDSTRVSTTCGEEKVTCPWQKCPGSGKSRFTTQVCANRKERGPWSCGVKAMVDLLAFFVLGLCWGL